MPIIPGTQSPRRPGPSRPPDPNLVTAVTNSAEDTLATENVSSTPPMPSDLPVVPVAGVSVADLVDSFGASRDGGARSHKGIDIFAERGTPALAAVSGTVVRAGASGGKAGNRVWIQDANGRFHFYAHLDDISVTEGQQVSQGQPIGSVGDTGNAQGTPPHLHYSVNSSSTSETGEWNPFLYLQNGQTVATPTTQFATASTDLPSDDDGDLNDTGPPQPTFRDIVIAALDQTSRVMAGGDRIPVNELTAIPEPTPEPILDPGTGPATGPATDPDPVLGEVT